MNMPSLADTQQLFWSSLTHNRDDVISQITSDDRFHAEQRIEVYRTTARSLHVSVLNDAFPVCRKILGENYFTQIAKIYFKDNPSKSEDLNQYGKTFPDFCEGLIRTREELSEYVYLGDLAHLEWMMQEAYFSCNSVKLDLEAFEMRCRKDPQSLVLSLQKNVSIMSSEYPVLTIWNAHQNVQDCHQQFFLNEYEYSCIHRNGYKVIADYIDTPTFHLLSAINENKSLYEITSLFNESELLNSSLAFCLQKGWLLV